MPRAIKPAVPAALQNFDLLPDSANVAIDVLCGLFNCSRPTIWRRLKTDPDFPNPRKFGASTRWNVGDLRRALAGAAA